MAYIVSIDGFIGPFETLLEAELAASAALSKHMESSLYSARRRNVVIAEIVEDMGGRKWTLFKR